MPPKKAVKASNQGNILHFFKPLPKVPEPTPSQPFQPSRHHPSDPVHPPASTSPHLSSPPPSQPTSPQAALVSRRLPQSLPRSRHDIVAGSDDDGEAGEDDKALSEDDDKWLDRYAPLLVTVSTSNQPALPADNDSSNNKFDDEDDDSDGFPDFTLPMTRQAVRRANQNSCVTPRAKRIAVEMISSSPTPIRSKVKYDMAALLQHAEKDAATEASAQRAAAVLEEDDDDSTTDTARNAEPIHTPGLYESIREILPGTADVGAPDIDRLKRDKLLAAVKRTEAAGAQKRWYFFDSDYSSAASPSTSLAIPPFPERCATGCWSFLAAASSRCRSFENGFVLDIVRRVCNLPDDIFLWVWHQILGVQKASHKLQEQYTKVIGACPHQVRRLISPEYIINLFRPLGAPHLPYKAIKSRPERADPYPGRDWSVLYSLLLLLADVAPHLEAEARLVATCILLQLGIDSLISEHAPIHRQFSRAIHALIHAVPAKSWNEFCHELITRLYDPVQEASLRWSLIASIPVNSIRLTELRRRLSLVFFFGNRAQARAHPDDTFSIPAVISHLDKAGPFVIDADTNFSDLAALASMLYIVLDDGRPPAPNADEATRRQHDADVDRLALKIRALASGIPQNGADFSAKWEARTVLRDLFEKIPHDIRTEPPHRMSMLESDEVDLDLPRQRAFMHNFFKKSQLAPD